MMIFKTVNERIEKKSYTIDIKNIDLADGHWGSLKRIAEYLDAIETFTYDKETFDRNLVLHALKLVKHNPRIEHLAFYRIPEENKIILLAITDVRKFKEVDLFAREMTISFNNEKFSLSIIEILKEESELIKKGEKAIPENWKFDEPLTNRFNKLRHYQF